MRDKNSNGGKRSLPFRTLEISLGVFILILTLLEPLSPDLQSNVTTILVRRENENSDAALPDVPDSKKLATGLEIHPWLPPLTGSYVKPLLREAAILLILQNVGVPLIGKFRTQLLVGVRCFIPLQRRFSSMVLSRKLFLSLQKSLSSQKVIRFVERHGRRLWKHLLAIYSKTNASKIVNRCKKYLHTFLHSHHDNADDQHQEAKQNYTETKSSRARHLAT
jgi:hypothetical protein